jgi:DNA-binding transcriptional LysR family regulator
MRIAQPIRIHCELEIESLVSERTSNLVEEGIDLAIRNGALADSSLIARKIGEFALVTVASACAIMSRPEFRSAPCDPRPAVSPAKSPCLLIFWLRCSPKRTTDPFPNGIDTIQNERLIHVWRN